MGALSIPFAPLLLGPQSLGLKLVPMGIASPRGGIRRNGVHGTRHAGARTSEDARRPSNRRRHPRLPAPARPGSVPEWTPLASTTVHIVVVTPPPYRRARRA